MTEDTHGAFFPLLFRQVFSRGHSDRTKQNTKQHLVDILEQGASAWSTWREYHSEDPDLSDQYLSHIPLRGYFLREAHLERAKLKFGHLEGANLIRAHLQNATLNRAFLNGAKLSEAELQGTHLVQAHLEQGDLRNAHLEGAYLTGAHMEGVNLSGAFFDSTTRLDGVNLGSEENGYAFLADVHWNGVNLGVVNWTTLKQVGEEYQAQQDQTPDGKEKTRSGRIEEYRRAVRANRQLSVALKDQGLNEEAAHFAYRAQVLQRYVLLLQLSSWQERKGAVTSLLIRLLIIVCITTLVIFFFLLGIASSLQSQEYQCQQQTYLTGSQSHVCPSLLTTLFQLSPVLLVPPCILFGVLLLSLLPLLFLKQRPQQSFKQALALLLSLFIGLLFISVPLFLILPLIVEYSVSILLSLEPDLLIEFLLFLIIWGLLGLPMFLPKFREKGYQFPVAMRLGFAVFPLLVSMPLLWQVLHSLQFSTLLPDSSYLQIFPLDLLDYSLFPFAAYIFLVFLLSCVLLPIEAPKQLKVWWALLLILPLCWLLILQSQLQAHINYLEYYPELVTLWQLGLLSPLVFFFLFVLVIPLIQRIHWLLRFRNWLLSQPKTFRKEIAEGYGQYTLSLFLDVLAGYGYRPGRTVCWYLAIILLFATTYVVVGAVTMHPLSWNEALIFSLTSFHGRGFFPGLGDAHPLLNPVVGIAAIEAVIGLVIEVSFIATFTQRFFGK